MQLGLGFGFRGGLGFPPAATSVGAQVDASQVVGLSIAATATNTRQYAQVSASQVIDVVASAQIGGSTQPDDLLTIITSRTPALHFSSDMGVTSSGGLVSQWNDFSGNARHATASGTARPTLAATDSNYGNRGSLTGDGVANSLSIAWNPAAPGTQPLWFFLVMRQLSWTAGEYIFGATSLVLGLAQSATTPQLRQFNTTGVNANGNLAVGTAGVVEAYFSNSASDYLRCGSAAAVAGGVSAGNSDAAAFQIFSRNGSGFGHSSIAHFSAWEGLPTPTEITNARAWAAAYYPGISV